MMPLTILMNEVRMRPLNKQMRYTTIVIISTMIKFYPGYLLVCDSPKIMQTISFLSRLFIIDIIHCIVVYVMRSMLFEV